MKCTSTILDPVSESYLATPRTLGGKRARRSQAPPDSLLYCDICKKHYSDPDAHEYQQHRKEVVTCEVCNKVFREGRRQRQAKSAFQNFYWFFPELKTSH